MKRFILQVPVRRWGIFVVEARDAQEAIATLYRERDNVIQNGDYIIEDEETIPGREDNDVNESTTH
jgi:hypothetical protein